MLIHRCSRRFLAAKLHVDTLSTKGNVKTLKEALKKLPTTLDELYDDAVQRIDFQNQGDKLLALKALRWVAYTYRPLSFRMLQQALAIEVGQVDFDQDSMHPIGLIIDVSAGLLIADWENKEVRLVHYTTQSYLDSLLTSRFQDAHSLIASDCITYMSYDTLQSEDPRPECSSRESKYLFWIYASTFWAAHAMARQSSELKAQVQRYLASNPWVCLISPADYECRWLGHTPRRCPGYGVAAFYGLYDELGFFLWDTVNINSLLCRSEFNYDGERPCGSALHLAARNNQIETLRLLLDHGADIEIRDLSRMTPLMLAVGCKSLTVVRELISRGANVMAEDSLKEIPFQQVHWSSSLPFLQYLIAAGTILERRHLFGASELMCRICQDNDVQTVQWLFECDLKDLDRTIIPSNMIPWAARHGAEESLYLVNKLLHCGADVNSMDFFRGESALHSACDTAKLSVVKVLLERGIEVNIRNRNGMVALHLAAESGDDEVVKVLITNKSAVNVQDVTGSTPLIAAVNHNKSSTALLLLQHGADVNFQDRNGITALHWASARGNIEIVQKLMEHKASVGYKSLFTLVVEPDAMILELLEYVRHFTMEQSLSFANYHGVVIQLFTAHEARDHKLFTKWQARLRSEKETRLGWNIWRQGMTALDIALLHGSKQIIRLLASGNISEGQADAIPRDEYLCEPSGLTPLDEVLNNERRKREIEKGGDQEKVSDTTSAFGERSNSDEP